MTPHDEAMNCHQPDHPGHCRVCGNYSEELDRIAHVCPPCYRYEAGVYADWCEQSDSGRRAAGCF